MTTTNMIAETLKTDINHGRLNSGDTIVEREIAAKFSASHIPVREALRILEGEGYIVHRKFSGYSVRVVTPEEMVELYDIHRFLCEKILTQAIPRYNELTFYNFRNMISEMGSTKDTNQIVSLFLKFSETAYGPAGLEYSVKVAMDILNRNIPVISAMVEQIYQGAIPLSFHEGFVKLCQEKETAKAIEWWLAEFDRLTKGLVAIMSRIRST